MDSISQLTVDIIAKVAEGKIDIVNAAKLLNKSRRTIECYLQYYHEDGIRFVVHRNSGSRPASQINDKLKRQVQSLIKKKYFVLNLVHLGEMLESNHTILVKRETLRCWAHEIHSINVHIINA